MGQLASAMVVEVLLEYARPVDGSGKRIHTLVDRILDSGPEPLMHGFMEVNIMHNTLLLAHENRVYLNHLVPISFP